MRKPIVSSVIRTDPNEYNVDDLRVYQLNAENIEEIFGFFFVEQRYSTLTWNGAIDFSALEHEVFYHLARHILNSGRAPNYANVVKDTVVSLILSSNELLTYRLKDPVEYTEYKKMLEDPYQILFIRYDIHGATKRPLADFSFSAENVQALSTHEGDLAIRLPRDHEWNPSILGWIVGNHSADEALSRNVHLVRTSSMLSALHGVTGITPSVRQKG